MASTSSSKLILPSLLRSNSACQRCHVARAASSLSSVPFPVLRVSTAIHDLVLRQLAVAVRVEQGESVEERLTVFLDGKSVTRVLVE